jgi:hypothetical protein
MSEELKNRIRVAMTDKQTADELIALLENMLARIVDLETP